MEEIKKKKQWTHLSGEFEYIAYNMKYHAFWEAINYNLPVYNFKNYSHLIYKMMSFCVLFYNKSYIFVSLFEEQIFVSLFDKSCQRRANNNMFLDAHC